MDEERWRLRREMTRSATAALLVFAAVMIGFEVQVHADATLEIDSCAPVDQAAKVEELTAEAGRDYDRGEVLYVQGDYAGAVQAFVASYCSFPYYTVLKDIGQSYERLLDYERAIDYLNRYLETFPAEAQNTKAAIEDRANVVARTKVLAALPATLRVASTPANAQITLRRGSTVVARGQAGGVLLEARAGTYDMTVELPGYEPAVQSITLTIGKPYSYYFQLRARRGRLRLRTVPADARIFVDKRLVGIGSYDDMLAGGTYSVVSEAPGRTSDQREVSVSADGDTNVTIRLAPPLETGRTELVTAAGIGGAALGGVAGSGFNRNGIIALGILGGAAVGVIGTYYGADSQVPLGDTSYIITTSIIGAATGVLATNLFTDDGDTSLVAGSLGLIVGATGGVLTARYTDLSTGDAALLSSGALWGTVVGGLFSVVFDGNSRVTSGISLTGLGTGVLAGALMARSFEPSRRHVALIDLAGLGGIASAAALQSLVSKSDSTSAESRAHFAIAGLGIGLLAGAFVTRNFDVPSVPNVQPTIQRGTSSSPDAMIFGISGQL